VVVASGKMRTWGHSLLCARATMPSAASRLEVCEARSTTTACKVNPSNTHRHPLLHCTIVNIAPLHHCTIEHRHTCLDESRSLVQK